VKAATRARLRIDSAGRVLAEARANAVRGYAPR
jgi:hypothetical protein